MSDMIDAAQALATLAVAYALMAKEEGLTEGERDRLNRKANAATFKAVAKLKASGAVTTEALE